MTDIVFNPYRIRFLNGEKLTPDEQSLGMMNGQQYLEVTEELHQQDDSWVNSDDEILNCVVSSRIVDMIVKQLKEDGLI